MRKLVARSFAAALVVVFISGCSSTGGKKSFSWSSMNPMTYFAKSDDSPVPKPSDQMAPTVTLSSASEVASANNASGGMAPASPYGQKGLGDTSYSSTAGQVSSANITPQRGAYNLNGYTGSLPPSTPTNDYRLSSPTNEYSSYAPQTAAGSAYNSAAAGTAAYSQTGNGYQASQNSGYSATPPAQYGLGGGAYDIQQAQAATAPAYATPSLPYGNNAAPSAGSNTSPYQMPPLPSQGNGYDSGLVQDPYRPSTTPYTGAGASTENSYSGYSSGYTADPTAVSSVASLPSLPSLPNAYSNTRPAYEPGQTGYTPPNVPTYIPPTTGGYVQQATATQPTYTPGSVSRYSSTASQGTSAGYGTTGGVY